MGFCEIFVLTIGCCGFINFCASVLFIEGHSLGFEKLRFAFWSHPANVYGTICTKWSLNYKEKWDNSFFFYLAAAKNSPEQILGSDVLSNRWRQV